VSCHSPAKSSKSVNGKELLNWIDVGGRKVSIGDFVRLKSSGDVGRVVQVSKLMNRHFGQGSMS
jgi:hypothetical protein